MSNAPKMPDNCCYVALGESYREILMQPLRIYIRMFHPVEWLKLLKIPLVFFEKFQPFPFTLLPSRCDRVSECLHSAQSYLLRRCDHTSAPSTLCKFLHSEKWLNPIAYKVYTMQEIVNISYKKVDELLQKGRRGDGA